MSTHNKPTPPARFINRELSWLAFNTRVLENAMNKNMPLLERVHYLSISAANLDEFYMVRVAGLKDQVRHDLSDKSPDGLTPQEQIEKIHETSDVLVEAQRKCWHKLSEELADNGIHVITHKQLTLKEGEWLRDHFEKEIFPILTPIAIDPAHPFPFLSNLAIAHLFQLQGSRGKLQIAVLPYPAKLPRFVRLPGKKIRLIALEEVFECCANQIFPGYEKVDSALFRIVRVCDLDVQEGAEDLVRTFERAVKIRRRGRVIRVRVMQPVSQTFKQFILDNIAVDEKDVNGSEGMLGMASLSELYALDRPDLKFPPFTVRYPERIHDFKGDCFAAIEAKDFIVHHPFETFDVVVQYLRQAAEDPNVVSIKQTLYRTSKDSPIVRALISAAENGKSVTAVVELKARFDEEANIKWARDLERAGVQVVFGFVKLKTHAKISLITRRVEGKLRSYVHFGTGNYHPQTAKVYTDLSFFTCDPVLCQDAAHFFNFVTGYAKTHSIKKLVMAPKSMRNTLRKLIHEEITHAKEGRPGTIWAKMNSLVDVEMIEALYEASSAGVKVELVVRGICCLRPGIKGLSENIRVKSIVGRFLEHSRIFCFGGGAPMPSRHAKVYIASADWMPRNFDWRVEVMVPIENETVHEQVLGQVMGANLKDKRQSWILQPDGSYLRDKDADKGFSVHDYFIHNPSLSGRGKAVRKARLEKYAAPVGPKA